MGGFRSLTDDKVFGRHASFYYALSAYHQELPQVALDMWKQILIKYPNWEELDEVNYWITRTSFEKKRYLEGLKYIQELEEVTSMELMEGLKQKLDPVELEDLLAANPDNQSLAALYFQSVSNLSYEERDMESLLVLARKYDFDMGELLGDFPILHKEKYGVALVLPFMFDSLQNPNTVIRNGIIFELYQGMLFAKDSLVQLGVELELYPYDTKKQQSRATEIVRSGELEKADLIIGPLYSGPNEAILPYANEKELLTINPLSSNGNIIGNNLNSYLFKPSFETQGRIAAEYAVSQLDTADNIMIVFETERDRAIAEAYKKVLEADSFRIVLFDQVDDEYARKIQAEFTDQFEEELDSLYTLEEIDSIALLPNRFVRSRTVRDEETGRILENRNGEDSLQNYEIKFTIPLDTVGHVFVASSSNLIANSFISLSEIRGDSIQITGYDSWLDFRIVSYDQLERLGVKLIHTNYFTEKASAIRKRIREIYSTETSNYHLMGFELIMQVGQLFSEQGQYIKRGLVTEPYLPGHVMKGLSFGSYNSNQVVPVVVLKDLDLKVENPINYEDGEK